MLGRVSSFFRAGTEQLKSVTLQARRRSFSQDDRSDPAAPADRGTRRRRYSRETRAAGTSPSTELSQPQLSHYDEPHIDHADNQVPAESLEQFAWLMLRGIEIRKVSRKAPGSKSPYKRYLYMNPQRTSLLSSKVAHAAANNEIGVRTQRFFFTEITSVEACHSHHSRLSIKCHPRRGRSDHDFQFEVDTERSRDILVRMLAKLVTHFSGRRCGQHVCDDFRVEEPLVLQGFECAICLSEIEDPVQLPCTHLYCRGCLVTWCGAAREAGNQASCPECRGSITSGCI